MKLEQLKPTQGAIKKVKRLGRGTASGHGKTSGKGHKGQKARSGAKIRANFEGGQTPLFRRIPKTGFSNARFKTRYATINVEDLNIFDDNTVVTPELLHDKGILKQQLNGVKVLGNGTINKKLVVKANMFSIGAKQKIEAIGGKAEVV